MLLVNLEVMVGRGDASRTRTCKQNKINKQLKNCSAQKRVSALGAITFAEI